MSVGDLSATMGLDVGEFVRSIDRALSSLDALSDHATKSIQRIETSVAPASSALRSISESTDTTTAAMKAQQAAVEEQSRTWSGFAASGLRNTRSALQDVGDATRNVGKALRTAGTVSWVVGLIPGMGVAGKVAKGLAPIFSATGKELKSAGWYAQLLGKNYDSKLSPAQSMVAESSSAVAAAQAKVAESSKSMLSSVSSLAGNLTTTGVYAALIWKTGLDEAAAASWKFLQPNSALMTSLSSVTASLSEAVETGINLFTDGIKGSATAVLTFLTGFNSIEEAVDAGGTVLTSFAKIAADSMKTLKSDVQEAGLIFGAAIELFKSGGTFNAGAYIEEGRRLNELAEQTAKTLAKQNELKSVLTSINDAAGKAAADARTKNELARIATLNSVDAIDQEIQALKLAAQARVANGTADKNWRKEQEDKAAALGKRREDLVSGKADKPDDTAKAIEAAQKKLDGLRLGEDELALATARANGASDEQVEKLRSLQEQIKDATTAQEAQKRIEDANAKAIEQISDLKDKYDELSGAASKADIAARKLVSEGVDESTANEIKQLTDKIEAQEKANKLAEQAEQARKKFAEQIAGLQDNVDLEAGNKTKGEIAKEKALREGATEEEAKKIGELTDKAEAEKETKKKTEKKSSGGSADNQAVLEGTAEAAKLAFGGSSRLESLAEKQILATKEVVTAVKENAGGEVPPGKDID